MKALEATGFLDDNGVLKLDNPLQIINQRVKVILLIPEQNEVENKVWIKAMATNAAFDFLKDEVEDIYSMNDGKPIVDEE